MLLSTRLGEFLDAEFKLNGPPRPRLTEPVPQFLNSTDAEAFHLNHLMYIYGVNPTAWHNI